MRPQFLPPAAPSDSSAVESRVTLAKVTTRPLPDQLLLWLDKVAQSAQQAVDQYDISISKPEDQSESDRLFLAIRDLRKVLEEPKKRPV
jgi:uncharacterized membrane protein YfbV (UPF0208 family)